MNDILKLINECFIKQTYNIKILKIYNYNLNKL